MLIVIVIIGVLAAALIPRLSSARGRANDTARKADLQQIATAIVAAQLDNANLPTTWGSVNRMATQLADAWISSIPTDPVASAKVEVGWATLSSWWQYAFIPVKKWWQDNAGFVLMAATETPGGSNRVVSGGNNWAITWTSNVEDLSKTLCSSFVKGASVSVSWAMAGWTWLCTYVNSSNLRYIVVY